MTVINFRNINKKDFRPYGQVIRMPKNGMPLSEPFVYYGVLALMKCVGPMQIGLFAAKNKKMAFTRLEQHRETEEFLFAARGDFIIPAALCGQAGCLNNQDIGGFLVKQGEGLVIKKGIWHTSPMPAGDDCLVVVAFKHGTPDNDVYFCQCGKCMLSSRAYKES